MFSQTVLAEYRGYSAQNSVISLIFVAGIKHSSLACAEWDGGQLGECLPAS